MGGDEDNAVWIPLSAEHARAFEGEARREIAPGHELYGLNLEAISKCPTCDSVTFRLPDESFALVHLTWAQKPDRPPWPTTVRVGGFVALEAAIDQHVH